MNTSNIIRIGLMTFAAMIAVSVVGRVVPQVRAVVKG